MTPTPQEERALPEGALDGMLDYSARNAIRDLIRRYGFDDARQRVAELINDEANRSVRQ